MTAKADLPRLASTLGLLGTMLEHDGTRAWDTSEGWENTTPPAASDGERGGGVCGIEAIDRASEQRRILRAAEIHGELRDLLTTLDNTATRTIRYLDLICPPHPAAARNRAGDLAVEDMTAADVATAGWCASCWRNDQQMVPITTNKRGLRYYRDRCKWCGEFRAEHKIDPPVELLRLRHEGRRLSSVVVDRAVKHARSETRRARSKPKRKKSRGRLSA